MEAKDTVMKATKEHPWSTACLKAAAMQAEISFKAGMREVVERLESKQTTYYQETSQLFAILREDWQALLKEVG